MTDAEIKNALEKAINEYAAEDVGSPKYFKLISAILDLFNCQQAKIEASQMDNKQLQSDVITANQNFDHINGLYEDEKSKLEKAKAKCVYFIKEVEKARAETDRVTALAAEWKDAAYTYADSIDRVKAEAIKEYKSKVENDIIILLGKSNCTEFIECLDYRYKEMVGDAE